MNSENTKKLVKRFPILYQNVGGRPQQTGMSWGFECGDGWFDLIWQLSLAIENELNYSWWQKRQFLFKKRLAQRWNSFIYWLSPVKRDETKMLGDGTKEDPFRTVIVKKAPPADLVEWFFKKIRPKMMDGPRDPKTGFPVFKRRWWLLGLSWTRVESGLKMFISFPNTGLAVSQVKEKFGTLRFYCPATEIMEKYINLAERLSAVTCEQCGEKGTLFNGGWYYTACSKHVKGIYDAYELRRRERAEKDRDTLADAMREALAIIQKSEARKYRTALTAGISKTRALRSLGSILCKALNKVEDP